MKKSPFLSLDIKDLIKGGIMTALTVVVAGAVVIVEGICKVPPVFPTLQTVETLLLSGLGVGVIYILKNFLSSSEDNFLKIGDSKPVVNL